MAKKQSNFDVILTIICILSTGSLVLIMTVIKPPENEVSFQTLKVLLIMLSSGTITALIITIAGPFFNKEFCKCPYCDCKIWVPKLQTVGVTDYFVCKNYNSYLIYYKDINGEYYPSKSGELKFRCPDCNYLITISTIIGTNSKRKRVCKKCLRLFSFDADQVPLNVEDYGQNLQLPDLEHIDLAQLAVIAEFENNIEELLINCTNRSCICNHPDNSFKFKRCVIRGGQDGVIFCPKCTRVYIDINYL